MDKIYLLIVDKSFGMAERISIDEKLKLLFK